MIKVFNNENLTFLAAFFLNLLLLLHAVSNLSISYYEADLFFNEEGLVGFIARLSCQIFGQNEFALRAPFLFIHFINSILIFKVSKVMLKRRVDRLISAIIYMFLPGVMASAILVNMAGIIIFFTLLFLYFFKVKNVNLAIFILILTIFIDKSFSVLYLAVFFYALYYKSKSLSAISGILFILNLIIYSFNIGGKPNGYFLDTIGVFAAVFSPFVFMFFVYSMYRIWVKEEKNLLWFIVITSFCASLLLSFRQRVELEEFLPYTAIAVPLMVRIFFISYRVRLPKFRKGYKALAVCLFMTLSVYSFLVVFNQVLYPLAFKDDPKKHFIYKYDIVKQLASELKNRKIYKVMTVDDELRLRLEFYGIENGGEYILIDEDIALSNSQINIYSFDTLKAKYYIF